MILVYAANTNGAGREAHAAVFLTLYIQNIKPEGVNPPHPANLYFILNQSLNVKCSRLGSWQGFGRGIR